jgi:ribonuclease HI
VSGTTSAAERQAVTRAAVLYADGAARGNPGPAGAGAVLFDESGAVLAELSRPLGRATNNVAEYEALILGLEEAKRRGVDRIDVRMDSMLVVRQMQGLWKIKHPGLRPLALRAGALLAEFPSRRIEHVPREENAHADRLANVAIDLGSPSPSRGRVPPSQGGPPPGSGIA